MVGVLQRGRIKLIPNDLYHLLTAFKDQSLAEIKDAHPEEDHAVIDEYYQFLLEDDWGFLCDEPESFPELDLSYTAAALITNAIVDVAIEHQYELSLARNVPMEGLPETLSLAV